MKNFQNKTTIIREAVGVFTDEETLSQVVFDLESHGFDQRQLSVLADIESVRRKLGYRSKNLKDLEDDPRTPRSFFVSRESIGIGQGVLISTPCLVASLVTAALMLECDKSTEVLVAATIAAGVIGAVLGYILAKVAYGYHLDYIQQQLDRGGLVLWIALETKEQEKRARNILKRHGAHDVHVREIPNYPAL